MAHSLSAHSMPDEGKVWKGSPSLGVKLRLLQSGLAGITKEKLCMDLTPHMQGRFVKEDTETWYRIDQYHLAPPFFIAVASDSDVWAFVSTAGSLAAGRRNAEGAFFPYETVDRIHLRWEHTGPRTWIRVSGLNDDGSSELWMPFAARFGAAPVTRSVWKNLSGTRLRFRETHPSGRLEFEYEWSTAGTHGLVRSARLRTDGTALRVDVLDGLLNLVPPGVSVAHTSTMSCLTDAYKWSELHANNRLGVFTLYAKIWDRAEPKESFNGLVAWHTALPNGGKVLLSDQQVPNFCSGGSMEQEHLCRGMRGAFLVNFSAELSTPVVEWQMVVDSPYSQVMVADLASRLASGDGTNEQLDQALRANDRGLEQLLRAADGLQHGNDQMATTHHRANVLFNIMRGGVFVSGTRLNRDHLREFIHQRNRPLSARTDALMAAWPNELERDMALEAARSIHDRELERAVLAYLPLTFSRRHGDPSRPWNKFDILGRDSKGQRIIAYQGNWRDIFQNWEALLISEPAYASSVILTFLGSMTSDGYNPYRISQDGIDWEVPEPENPWSSIGYWSDHQVIYLLRILELAQATQPTLVPYLWNRALFSFADIPYRLKCFADQISDPKHTILFDPVANEQAQARAQRIGSDGLMVCDANDQPLLATLAEKLAIILIAKAGSLVPGGGIWLHTQRPEWNDANNALVGNGVSVVTLAQLRRLLVWIDALPCADQSFDSSDATLKALADLEQLFTSMSSVAISQTSARRAFVNSLGQVLDSWQRQAYRGSDGRHRVTASPGILRRFARCLLVTVDATLRECQREDGLFDSYKLVDFRHPSQADLTRLYPMLEGQVSVLSSGFLSLPQAVELLQRLFASPLYDKQRRSFLLYPDRSLPGFLERNILDKEALDLTVTQRILATRRTDLLQQQADGTVRFASDLSNRADLETAGQDFGEELQPLAEAYDRIMNHHAFTGRSGTMFAYEGLGCIYWHMVAKLMLAVQERVFEAADVAAPELTALKSFYRRIRDGLGYRKSAQEYGAFPFDPYSHTPSSGGAQQPGMTGQVKEEIMTRWGELGIRFEAGSIRFDPVLLDTEEIPPDSALTFSLQGKPVRIRLATQSRIRLRCAERWITIDGSTFSLTGVDEIDIEWNGAGVNDS